MELKHTITEPLSPTKYVDPKLYESCMRLQQEQNNRGLISETQFEDDCLLAVMNEARKILVLELGAGYGRISVNASKAAKSMSKEYYCIAVEAEPTHYIWCRENFCTNDIEGKVIHSAVSDKLGSAYFLIGSPESQYGQRMLSWTLGVLFSLLKRATVIQSIPLDHLIRIAHCTRAFPVFMHMDIQGAELNVLTACQQLSTVEYLYVNTHKHNHCKVLKLLQKSHIIAAELPPNSKTSVRNVGIVATQDGIIFGVRNDLV